VLKPIVVAAALIFAVMVAVKDGRVLHTAGLTGSCSTVTAPGGAVLEACRAGRLEGRPDLTKRSCTRAGVSGKLEYWRCPAGVQASDVGR
jgi:hypothetical protein